MVKLPSWAIGCAIAAWLASAAVADNPRLAQARTAIAALRYDAARVALADALRGGDNSPAELAEIYRLTGEVAIVLGDREAAEQAYRRHLALDPRATLASDASPKLREPFAAAQQHMASRGGLTATASHVRGGIAIVVHDPLAMANAVARDGGAPIALSCEIPGDGGTCDRTAIIPLAVGASIVALSVLDDRGNRLLEISQTAVRPPAEPPLDKPLVTVRSPSRWRNWRLWLIPTGAAMLTGIVLGRIASDASDELFAISTNSQNFFASEANAARVRRDRYGLAANIAFATGAGCAVVSAVLYAIRPRGPVVVPTGRGLAVVTQW